MSRTLAVLAALGLAVGAAGPTDAGPIYTYTFTTDTPPITGPPISGSFQVDSSVIATSGNTDISSFITNISFTGFEAAYPAPKFAPETVTVTPAGDLTMGAGESRFFGVESINGGSFSLGVNALGMNNQIYTGTLATINGLEDVLQGVGHWTLLVGGPAPVPEPSTFILAGISGLGLMAVLRRRRRDWVVRLDPAND